MDMEKQTPIFQAVYKSNQDRWVTWYARDSSVWLYPTETQTAHGGGFIQFVDTVRLDRTETQWTPGRFYAPMFTGGGMQIVEQLLYTPNSLDWHVDATADEIEAIDRWHQCAGIMQPYLRAAQKVDESELGRIESLFQAFCALRVHLLAERAAEK